MNSTPVQSGLPPLTGRRAITLVELIVLLAIMGIMAMIILPTTGSDAHGLRIKRSVNAANLRVIGQAILAMEHDRPGALSAAKPADIYIFAAQIGHNGLNNPTLWLSKVDATNPYPTDPPETILVPCPDASCPIRVNPKFLGLPLAFAVASFPPGTDITKLPPTTPLAWTRGLQPDGKWSKKLAPYGNWGGFILFANGNLDTLSTINDQLVKFGTTQPTSDIREALPPGTRILESKPKR
jgi:type II secretory pathway pseudopilin PulG